MGQGKDQGTDCHQQDTETDPARLRRCGTSAEIGEWDEDAERGKVIGTGDRCKLRGLEIESALNCGDADVDQTVDDDSCGGVNERETIKTNLISILYCPSRRRRVVVQFMALD